MSKSFETELNSKEITDALNHVLKETKNLEPAFKIARKALMDAIDENFETEGASSGERFKEWSDKYAKTRAKKKKGEGKILQLEGLLRKSISSKITRNELVIGSDKEYASAHQFGYAPQTLTPARLCGFADGRNEVSPDSEQIEPSRSEAPQAKLCERGANPRQRITDDVKKQIAKDIMADLKNRIKK